MLTRLLPDIEPREARQSLSTIISVLQAENPAEPADSNAISRGSGKTSSAAGAMTPVALFTDGASRGNPGLAGAGYVLIDDAGEEVETGYQFLGQCTNNVAEYRALLLGLKAAAGKGCGNLAVFLDSELIVKQLKGEYRVKDEKLKPLYEAVKKSCSLVGRCRFSHVPRSRNQRADQLANRAIDERNS
jgi:ribonuclease HI/probable phosphoglycerate mutase